MACPPDLWDMWLRSYFRTGKAWRRLMALDTIRRQPFFGQTKAEAGDRVRIGVRAPTFGGLTQEQKDQWLKHPTNPDRLGMN